MKPDFWLGKWLVQPAAGLITRGKREQKLAPKVMDVLQVLADAEGEVVTRQKIMDSVWSDQIVGDDLLTTCISTLRRALHQDDIPYIQTLPKRGYRLLLATEPASAAAETKVRGGKNISVRGWLGLVLTLATATASIIWWRLDHQPGASPDNRSIAVLPFEVFSERSDSRHFADGLAEELIHQLTADPGRRVIARTSSFKFRDQNRSIPEIARTLNVRHVIEGSVRDSEAGMRITIQLIDTVDDFHIWSRVFDVDRENLIDVQEQVGKAVARLIPTDDHRAMETGRPRHPVSDAAYRLYLLGQSHMRVGSVKGYATALALFSDAVRIAPDYALAHSQIATANLLLYQYRHDPLEEASARARAALQKAMEIDPDLPEAHAVSGLLYTYLKDYPAAETAFKRAIALRPRFGFAQHNFGFMLWSQARFKEALVHLNIALDSDPLSGASNFLVGDSLAGLGQFEAAKAQYRRCQQVLPERYACYGGPATIEILLGNYAAAAVLLERAGKLVEPGFFYHDITLASLAIRQGKNKTAAELLASAAKKSPTNYNLLKSSLLLALQAEDLARFEQRLVALNLEHPDDRDLKLITALSQYFSSNCESSIAIYEQESLSSDAFLFDYWDLGSGFSHLGNMAFCYTKLGLDDRAEESLAKLGEFLVAGTDVDFAGKTFLRARYLRMSAQKKQSDRLLEQLASIRWPLLWLSKYDPAIAE